MSLAMFFLKLNGFSLLWLFCGHLASALVPTVKCAPSGYYSLPRNGVLINISKMAR